MWQVNIGREAKIKCDLGTDSCYLLGTHGAEHLKYFM